MEKKQEHRFVMTNEVVASAFQEENDTNMKYVEKPEQQVCKIKNLER